MKKQHLINILFIFCIVALGHTLLGLFWIVQGKEYCILEPSIPMRLAEFILFGLAFIVSLIVFYIILFRKKNLVLREI